jgi:regulator of cell morphogenesis and NO signaling
MIISLDTPVSDIATVHPEAISVFEEFGIEYCCRGDSSLRDTCISKAIAPTSMVEALQARDHIPTLPLWGNVPLSALCRYISERHHGYERGQLTLIRGLLDEVQRKHGVSHPEVFFIGELIEVAESGLFDHYHLEEDDLFRCIANLERDPYSLPATESNHITTIVERILQEHHHTGTQLDLLREKTNNYRAPTDACSTFRSLWKALEELVRDIHMHVHLEHNILFPRVMALTHIFLQGPF